MSSATAAVALLIISMMWPSEGAINGDGLHWAFLWIVLASVMCWVNGPAKVTAQHQSLSRRIAPYAPVVILIGVWVSTWFVFRGHADRRSALNVAFEWSGILAAAVTFWRWPGAMFRQQVGRVLIGVAIGAAMMGIVQHHVVWQQRSDWYAERMQAIDDWNETGIGAAEAQQASAELTAEGVPLEGAQADTFRRRLLDSTEPVGPFALANTLGGLLSVGLILMVNGLFQSHLESRGRWRARVGKTLLSLALLVTGYALVLTKSRTAWVAFVIGVVWLIVCWNADRRGLNSTSHSRLIAIASLLVGGLCLLGVGVLVGAIDREVLLESPRSLRFRLMYWMGTVDLLKDHWLFGAGPGNFRNLYLGYKIPESSEQILDPHNLLLDTYSNAGFMGLVGLLLMLVTGFGRSRTSQRSEDSEICGAVPVGLKSAAGIAMFTFAGWYWWRGGEVFAGLMALPDSPLLVLLIPVGVLLSGLLPASAEGHTFQACFVTLVVHLMGAGAFHITAVGLMLVLLHRGTFVEVSEVSAESGKRFATGVLVLRARLLSFGFACLAGVVLFAGLRPTLAAQQALAESRMAEANGNQEQAVSAVEEGIKAAPFDVTLRQRKAELLTYALLSEPTKQRSVEPALQACEEWKTADSTGFRNYAVTSQIHEAVWLRHGEDAEFQAAVDSMSEAVARYPTNAEFTSRLALLLAAGQRFAEAQEWAEVSLIQDELNQQWGHAELYLDDSVRGRLSNLR